MTRIKASNTTYKTRADFEAAVDKAAALQLKLEADVAEHNRQKAAQDKAFKNRVKKAQAAINEIVVAAESYAAHHRDDLLAGKQTAETKLAYFGYRRSPGIIKTLNSKWTLAKAVEALKAAGKTACIKIRESLDKDAVKSQIPEAEMAKFGLRIAYPEEFGITPKRAEETPAKKITT